MNQVKHITHVISAAALAAVVGAGTLTAGAFNRGEHPAASATVTTAVAPLDQVARIPAGTDSFAPIVERVAPAVVTIRSTRSRTSQPLYGQRRGPNMPPQSGLGSGAIVSADGYVLTNHHVIAGADQITVELSDRRSFKATIVGSDQASDLAVLRIKGTGFPTLPLGDSDRVRVGDVVLALGNPLGIGQTVTMGIVSAKGRATGLGDGSYEDFLQTDAPINSGNSGGALVNTRGELVGINSQILSPTGGNIGVGFAIPANMAKHVMQSLVADGRVHRGMIGVTVQTVTSDDAEHLGLQSVAGAIVSSVEPGGPAADAGVQPGDVITAINETPVADSNTLRNTVAQSKPGSLVRLTLIRDGRPRTVTATLDELPSRRASDE
jgi:serine protease Do